MAPTLGPSNICVPAAYGETLNDTVLKEDMGCGQERDQWSRKRWSHLRCIDDHDNNNQRHCLLCTHYEPGTCYDPIHSFLLELRFTDQQRQHHLGAH